MGLLVDGEWKDDWYDTRSTGGAFVRPDTLFRDRIETTPGARFRPEADRYHLYVSLACPWAHRTLIVRALKGLEDVLPISVVNPLMLEHGWTFEAAPGTVPDPIFGAHYLYEIYLRARPRYSGRVSVPVLWDRREQTIVNNESADIVRMLSSAFDVRLMVGLLFIALVLGSIVLASRTAAGRPIAFGLSWFLLGLIPTAVIPMSEVVNDHRMCLPNIGLAMALGWLNALRITSARRVPESAPARIPIASINSSRLCSIARMVTGPSSNSSKTRSIGQRASNCV